jgi:hypothetical protein
VIERTVEVAIWPARAFDLWVKRVDLWWPPGHRVSGEPDGTLHFEPGVGGRFFERTAARRELDYGRVVTWQPPTLLAYDFFLGSGPEAPTRVEVRFVAIGAGTRVEVRHTPGALAADRFDTTAPRYRASWDHVTAAFAAHARTFTEVPR